MKTPSLRNATIPCPHCQFKATGAQGLAAHVRFNHADEWERSRGVGNQTATLRTPAPEPAYTPEALLNSALETLSETIAEVKQWLTKLDDLKAYLADLEKQDKALKQALVAFEGKTTPPLPTGAAPSRK